MAAAPSPLRRVVLPRDHGAHPAFQVEWWYTAGTVADRRGQDYFWFATVWSGSGFIGLLLRTAPGRGRDADPPRPGDQRQWSGWWFDHQWGNFAMNSASWHWNWFACQFQHGGDLMLYQFIDPTGRPTGVQSGTFVPAAHLDITLVARARHQFISNQYLPGFWEGAAAVTSSAAGGCIVESTREPASVF